MPIGLISIHALRMERDLHPTHCNTIYFEFLSTRSAWSATVYYGLTYQQEAISIHALRMERDSRSCCLGAYSTDFYPRAPHGARPISGGAWMTWIVFLSTRSAWSATRVSVLFLLHCLYFYPRAPHGARHPAAIYCDKRREISIHALRMERDLGVSNNICGRLRFLSTRSAWSATAPSSS